MVKTPKKLSMMKIKKKNQNQPLTALLKRKKKRMAKLPILQITLNRTRKKKFPKRILKKSKI